MKKNKNVSAVNAGESRYKRFRNSGAVRFLYDKGVAYFILAFFIPFIIMVSALMSENIHLLGFYKDVETGKTELGLTGGRQMLVVDLWHQYFPFFRVVREKLVTGGSFLYSWQNGMGTNFISLISYYAASPLNWIAALFSESHSREVLTYLLAAKVGFASAFFSCFLRYTYKRKDLSIVFFSIMYALCSYVLGYYWNVMWFDTFALFPLVMLGIVAVCREGKWKTYTVALALSLISNYYIGFFTCIFSVFMFAASAVINWDGFKKFGKKLRIIVRSSVIGIGLGAFMLLPSYYALQLTYGANNTFPSQREWFNKWYDIFGNMLSYSEPTTKEGLPNFACGMLALTLLGVFLFSAGIKIREKVASVLMMALIAVSCNMNQLNYMWHGFHVTNQLPYRYAFIFSFVLVAAAYRAYDIMLKKNIKIYQLCLLVIGPAAALGLAYLSGKKSENGFEMTAAFKSSMIITGAYIMIFAAVKLIPIKIPQIKRAILNISLAAALCTEFSGTAVIGVKTVGSSDYKSYPTSYDGVKGVMDTMLEQEQPLFYRAEMTGTYTLNDSALYGYNGVSQFSSSANVSVTKMFKNLGLYGSEAGNRFYYRTSTPVTNGLLGIDYLISRGAPILEPNPYLEFYTSSETTYMYKNTHPLSLGFVMDSGIKALDTERAENPFEYQNTVMRLASGTELTMFTPQPVKMAYYEKMEPLKKKYGVYSFSANESGTVSAAYEFAGVENGCLFGYGKNGCYDSIDVKKNDISIESNVSFSDYPVVFPMGNIRPGETVKLKLNFPAAKRAGVYEFYVYSLNMNNYDFVYEKFARQQLNITEFEDTCIKGNITSEKDGVLYLSIPYEKGWTVYIDGKETETYPVLGAMLGADITVGDHEIVLKYRPDGFGTGLNISCASLILFILFAWLDSRRKKNQPVVAADITADAFEEFRRGDGSSEMDDVPEANAEEEKADDEKQIIEEAGQEPENVTDAEAEKAEPTEQENAEDASENDEIPAEAPVDEAEAQADTENTVSEETEEKNEESEGNNGLQGD